MTDETQAEKTKREVDEIVRGIMKISLQLDPRWWKVRFLDLIEKYKVESAHLRKDPALVQFTIGGQQYTYMKFDGVAGFRYVSKAVETPESTELFEEMAIAGIITKEGEVNYEYNS